ERDTRHGIDAGQDDEHGRDADQEHVACRPANEGRDHFAGSGCVNACRAAFRLLSASIKNVAEVTTSSPALSPSSTSTYPSPRRPSLTGRGSNRPSPFATRTTVRFPLSIIALAGTAMTGVLSPA